MNNRIYCKTISVILLGAATAMASSAQSVDPLLSFNQEYGTSTQPVSLVQGADANLYGTTSGGGTLGNGGVVKITTAGTLTPLYSFAGGVNGQAPSAGLALGTDGNFYGTTLSGGTAGGGVFFNITPQGTITIFDDPAGGYGALTQGINGNFYGTSVAGSGSIFEVSPTGAWTVLHPFAGGTDGCDPYAGLVQASDGNFYGTTYACGAYNYGAIFRLTPLGAVTTLYSFTGGADGAHPNAAMVPGPNGQLYGTTKVGGAHGYGTVFQVSPKSGLVTLHAFTAGADGGLPYGGLIQATDGNLYGTTQCCGASGHGTIFTISLAGTLTTLYSFTGGLDGGAPEAALLQCTDGNFYGTTTAAGKNNRGTVFRLIMGLGHFVKTVPHAGPVGTAVTILGTDLVGTTSVTFNGTPAAFTLVSGTEITATVPAGATAGIVQVVTGSGTLSSAGPFLVLK